MKEVVIVSAKRTALGSFLGSLKDVKAADLASKVVDNIVEESKIDLKEIDEVILGEVLQAGQGQNVARQLLLNSGIDESKVAFTVNKVCGSGLKALELAYQAIALGDRDVVLAGGAENMSLAPYLLNKAREGYKMGDQKVVDSIINDGLWCAFNDYHMGITAENLAKQYNLSREQLDEFALASQQKASKAIENGVFKDEIVPLTLKTKKGEVIFDKDEFVKSDSNLEKLAKLRPAFDKNGVVTAGNSSGVNDGAAMLLMMSKEKAEELKLPILAKVKAFASAGVDPSIMGIGAAAAAKKVLEKANLKIEDIDLIEANEAFASQSLATLEELKADKSKVNVNGGAIALGHPIGASGARIVVTLLHQMQRSKAKYGLATLCIGGGQGIAAIFEKGE